MKSLLHFAFCFLLGISELLLAQTKITNRLAEALIDAERNGTIINAIIFLKDQYNIRDLDAQLTASKATLKQRAYSVITELKQHAAITQHDLLNFLKSKSQDEIPHYQNFWISNVITIEAKPQILSELEYRSDVSVIDLDLPVKIIEPIDLQSAPVFLYGNCEINLKVINAHKMWQEGFTGLGVILMNIDTGVDGNHPALSARWHGNYVPWNQAWHDPYQGTTFPTDNAGHGTGTMSVLTGFNSFTEDTVGVAFNAHWIASRFQSNNPPATTSHILSGMSWALDPDGNPLTINDMPAVINCSFGSGTPAPTTSPYEDALMALEAAGIAVIWAAGNFGPNPGTIGSPANLKITETIAFSVGGIYGYDSAFPINPLSSRGPTNCTTGIGNQIKPEVTAPIVARACQLNNEYNYWFGTSIAAPHAAGAVALLKQAFPNKTGSELIWMLYGTALDLGTPGENNDYGMGVIDVYQAYLYHPAPDDPRRPLSINIYSDYTAPNSAEISWTDPSMLVAGNPLTNFYIQIWRNDQFIISVGAGIENYTDSGLSDGEKYLYELRTHDLSTDSLSVPVAVSVYAGGSPFPAPPSNLTCSYAGAHVLLSWDDPITQSDGTPLDDLEKIYLFLDNVLMDSIQAGVENYTDNPDTGFTVHYHLRAVDHEIPPKLSEPGERVPCFIGGIPDILVWAGTPINLPPFPLSSGDSLFEALAANGKKVFLTDDLFEFGNDLSDYKAIFVALGVFPFHHILLTNGPEAPALENYLANGGRLYLEGGDSFNPYPNPYFPPSYNIKSWFGLGTGNSGSADLFGIVGQNSLESFTFDYEGINSFMNELNPVSSTVIWKNSQNNDVNGVLCNEFGSGISIGVVPSFGGLVDSLDQYTQSLKELVRGKIKRFPVDRTHQKKEYLSSKPSSKFVKKFAYLPELEDQRKRKRDPLEIYGNKIGIRANTKIDLMAVYLELLGYPVGIDEGRSKNIPLKLVLSQNYPNPFNPTTTIEFDLPKASEAILKVYNILGEEVATLVSDRLSAGSYSYEWDASNFASGVYLYKLEAEGHVDIRKMILMK